MDLSAAARPTSRRKRLITRALASASLVAAVVLTLGLAQTAYADTVLADSFEDGDAADWMASGGTWSVVTDGSRVLTQTRSTTASARFFNGSTAWANYRVQARVKPLNLGTNGFAAILARASSTTSFYRLALLTGDRVQLQVIRGGRTTVLGTVSKTVTAGTWYTLALDVSGSTIRGFVDSALVLTATNTVITSGRIGVQTSRSTAEFDDVVVTQNTVTPTTPPPTTPPTTPPTGSTVTVAADGSGNFATVQAAVDSVPANNQTRVTINITPGTYKELVVVPQNKPFVSFVGQGASAADTVITFDNASGTLKPDGTQIGTGASATVITTGHDFVAQNLTFANSFDEKAHPEITNQQAVAVQTNGDRLTFDNVRFLGNQDTLLPNSPNVDTPSRIYFRGCYIEGDVDFIFGRGTAVFDRCEIRSLDRGSTSNNGYVTAASTSSSNALGFLFTQCTLTSSAMAATVFLGRPWHPGNDPNAIAQVVFRDSTLGAHIKSSPWTDMSGFSWKDARFDEFRNSGAGSILTADRPQLTNDEALDATPQEYLAGTDNWNPIH